MFYRLKRHPFPLEAHFEFTLVLTYAFPRKILEPLLFPGLELDTFCDFGFVAIALVQTTAMRPKGFPAWIGQSFFLTGYRIFTRYKTRKGQNLRGLRILRSDTDKLPMVFFGNVLTHYKYHLASVDCQKSKEQMHITINSADGKADLEVMADLDVISLPPSSPFADDREARKFVGPLPFTFDYEEQTHSIIRVEGVRKEWAPRLVNARVQKASFFDQQPFDQELTPKFASAFYLEDVAYFWRAGVKETLIAGRR
jgi:hypothetical protein